MNSLKALQQAMQAAIMSKDDSVAVDIVKPNNMTVAERLNIYRNAYYLRFIDVLSDDFSALCQFMGEDAFSSMIHAYLQAYPSYSFSIHSVGKDLPQFLQDQGCDLVYCELASFEWMMIVVSTQSDSQALAISDLQPLSPEEWAELTLEFQPSLGLIHVSTNAIELWEAIESEKAEDFTPLEYDTVSTYVIWRTGNEVFYRAFDEQEDRLLHAITQGYTFSELCGAILVDMAEDEAVEWVASRLRGWIELGFFKRVAC